MYSSGLKASKLVCSKDWNVNGISDPIKNPEGNNSSLMSYSFCFLFMCLHEPETVFVFSSHHKLEIFGHIFDNGTHMKLDEAYGLEVSPVCRR